MHVRKNSIPTDGSSMKVQSWTIVVAMIDRHPAPGSRYRPLPLSQPLFLLWFVFNDRRGEQEGSYMLRLKAQQEYRLPDYLRHNLFFSLQELNFPSSLLYLVYLARVAGGSSPLPNTISNLDLAGHLHLNHLSLSVLFYNQQPEDG